LMWFDWKPGYDRAWTHPYPWCGWHGWGVSCVGIYVGAGHKETRWVEVPSGIRERGTPRKFAIAGTILVVHAERTGQLEHRSRRLAGVVGHYDCIVCSGCGRHRRADAGTRGQCVVESDGGWLRNADSMMRSRSRSRLIAGFGQTRTSKILNRSRCPSSSIAKGSVTRSRHAVLLWRVWCDHDSLERAGRARRSPRASNQSAQCATHITIGWDPSWGQAGGVPEGARYVVAAEVPSPGSRPPPRHCHGCGGGAVQDFRRRRSS
jgi:hypothetical protein